MPHDAVVYITPSTTSGVASSTRSVPVSNVNASLSCRTFKSLIFSNGL